MQEQMNMPRYRVKKAKRPKSSVKSAVRKPRAEGQWNDRWNIAESKGNKDNHPFYRQYFDKEPAMNHKHFLF